jgi:MSHA pilin protein MshD
MCILSRAPRRAPASRRRASGFTLIELIVFILVVSIALVGVLLVMNVTAARSSDPLVRKQALAVAEALLEEVALMPATLCDPDDAHVTTATSNTVNAADPTQCASLPEATGPEAGESRYSAGAPFDNVNDYHGFDTATAAPHGVRDITGTLLAGLSASRASISVQQAAFGNPAFSAPAAASYSIAVTVTGPGGETVTLQGHRSRHAPRTP